MTAPQQHQLSLPDTVAGLAIDASIPGLPVVILRLETGAARFDVRIDARKAAQFGAQIGQGLAAVAAQALAAAGPQIVTPPGAGGLIVPGRPS